MSEPTREPGLIRDLRTMLEVKEAVGNESDFTLSHGEMEVLIEHHDAIVAERDEWRDAAKWSEGQHQHWKTVASATARQLVALSVDHSAELVRMKARLAACEKIVEAAKAYEKWMGKWHDYTVSCGDKPAKQQRALIDAVRAAVAAETTTTTKDTTL
jgi:hypothetical protein